MNRKFAGIVSISLIVICIGYIIYDIATGKSDSKVLTPTETESHSIETNWLIDSEFFVDIGKLSSIAITDNDLILCAGDSFLACYDIEFNLLWQQAVDESIYALAESEGVIYAAGHEEIMVFDSTGQLLEKWGPYDDGALLTGISANQNYVAFADAGNQLVFVTDKRGALKSIVGHPGNQFIIPSAYFDVIISDYDTLIIANTGKRNIEFRTIKGDLIRSIGEEGDEFENFCGCCNPSHIDILPDGNIVTAEKGINRLKITRPDGSFLEPVAQPEHFAASIPLDISVSREGLIYGANRKDSKIYVFKRIN
jgi:hypothetical protein